MPRKNLQSFANKLQTISVICSGSICNVGISGAVGIGVEGCRRGWLIRLIEETEFEVLLCNTTTLVIFSVFECLLPQKTPSLHFENRK